jgi:hypothetical protein
VGKVVRMNIIKAALDVEKQIGALVFDSLEQIDLMCESSDSIEAAEPASEPHL